MKEKILLLILICFFSCKNDIKSTNKTKNLNEILPNQNKINKMNDSNDNIVETDEGVRFLKKFYSNFYFDENKDFTFSDKKEFLSKRINSRIDSLNSDSENIELDYDPFIKAQDFYGDNIKNTIKFNNNGECFVVTFINFEEEGEIRLEFKLGKNKQGKIEIVVNEDDESFDFETESTIYLGECFSDNELNELLEKNFAHIIRIKEEYKTNL